MSGKIKKRSEDVSFSLSRWFRKAAVNAPAITVVTVIGMAYVIFLFGGGLFTLIEKPLPAYYSGSQFYFIYPNDISNQFVGDTIISVALYALGFVGLLAIYQSTKNAYKPRQAYMLLIVGVTLVLISYIFLEAAISIKGG
jgi:OST3 / OST6 family.